MPLYGLFATDGGQINSFFALPSFLDKFGVEKAGKKSIPTNYQSAFQTVGIPGAFIGLFICGWAQERYGSRKTYLCGMAACICVIFLFVFAQSLGMLLGAEAIAAGIWALFSEPFSSPANAEFPLTVTRHFDRCLCR
jgi:SP family general alpha glucoside:H+ symporter-like MFS transporter